jgi:hypothetical protein
MEQIGSGVDFVNHGKGCELLSCQGWKAGFEKMDKAEL